MFKSVLVVYKKSNYEKYVIEDHYLKLKRNRGLVKPLLEAHRVHYQSLEEVERTLQQLKIKFTMMVRSKPFYEKDYDLIITVGGDGTFLDAAQFITSTTIMGVNSNIQDSVGHFCAITSERLKMFLDKKNHQVVPTSRLKVVIDGEVQRPVLNDVLITNINPASTSRYTIKIGHISEQQKSSGIWISTAMGSTAAIFGAGGKVMNSKSTKFQVKIREPYFRQKRHLKNDLRILPATNVVNVLSGMRDGMVYLDGTKRSHSFIFGSHVLVSGSAPKLKMLTTL